MRTQRPGRGFTLIELLVVIAIIGLLSSVVLASLNSARLKSRDARRLADLKQLQTALELYYGDQSPPTYPVTVAGGTTLTSALASLAPNQMQSIPKDPSKADNSTTGYLYCSTDGQSYAMLVIMEKNNTRCVIAQGTSGNCGWASSYSTCQ